MTITTKGKGERATRTASLCAVLLGTALLAMALLATACAEEDTDLVVIGNLMHATWDRPDAALVTGPIAVADAYAVADWTQERMGGRALLRKHNGKWAVILCAGDILTTAAGLIRVGVPQETAEMLVSTLASLEQNVSAERLDAMSKFLEIVPMEN